MEQQNRDKSNVGELNDAFEDIAINSDNTINNVTISAEDTIAVHAGPVINIHENCTIDGNISSENNFDIHLWICPSKGGYNWYFCFCK